MCRKRVAPNSIKGFGNGGTGDQTDGCLQEGVDPGNDGEDGRPSRAPSANIFGIAEQKKKPADKEHGVQNGAAEGCHRERDEIGFVNPVQGPKDQADQPAHQNPGNDGQDEGVNGIEFQKDGAESTKPKTLNETGNAENGSQKGSGSRSHQNGSNGDGDHDQGDLKTGGFDVANGCEGHENDDGCQYGRLYHPQRAGSAFVCFHI